VPLKDSVCVLLVEPGSDPPKTKPAVVVPTPPAPLLAKFNVAGEVVQFVPSQISVAFESEPAFPPAATAAVCKPNPAISALAVLRSFTSVQLVPL
jgi:hypothetical protein